MEMEEGWKASREVGCRFGLAKMVKVGLALMVEVEFCWMEKVMFA